MDKYTITGAELTGREEDAIEARAAWDALSKEQKDEVCRMLMSDEDLASEGDWEPRNAKGIEELRRELRVGPRAVEDYMKAAAVAAQKHIDDRLCDSVTLIANEMLASAAWLYVVAKDDHLLAHSSTPSHLQAVFAFKNRRRDERLSLHERSIVTHVARSGKPHVAPYVWDDLYYRPTLDDTKSAVAVPVKAPSGELLGVLHLESGKRNRYRNECIPKIEVLAEDLVPLLLRLRALNHKDAYWFPWHTFNLSVQLHDICHDIRRALDPNGIQCTIWMADWEKKSLFINATTGQAGEYRHRLSLPFQSFNGELSKQPAGATGIVRPFEKAQYRIPAPTGEVETREGPYAFVGGKRKKYWLKWRLSKGAPIYARMPTGEPEALSTITLSCFDEQDEAVMPSDSEMTEIAEQIGDFITGFLALRRELAEAHLARTLRVHRRPKEAFKAIARQFIQFFGLKGIAIDGYLPGDDTQLPLMEGGADADVARLIGPNAVWNPLKTIHQEIKDEAGNKLGVLHLARHRPFSISERELIRHLAQLCSDVFTRWRTNKLKVLRRAFRRALHG